MSTPVFGCPQSLRRMGSALLSALWCMYTAPRFRCVFKNSISFRKLNLISVTVITVSFGTSNTFLNLVKDLNKSELVPQVPQYWTILETLSYNTLHSLEINQQIATVPIVPWGGTGG